MSEEHARQFIRTIEQDSVLQQKIGTLDEASAVAETVKLGAEQGLDFTEEEFRGVLDTHLKSAAAKEMTEEELSGVSGGFFTADPGYGEWMPDVPSGGPGRIAHEVQPNYTIPIGTPYPTYWVKYGTYNP